MAKILIKFRRDWADEFTCEEFRIVDGTLEEVREKLERGIKEEIYFGSNEGYHEGDLEIDDFELSVISEEIAKIIEKYIGTDFGVGPIGGALEIADETEE